MRPIFEPCKESPSESLATVVGMDTDQLANDSIDGLEFGNPSVDDTDERLFFGNHE
jgi:hypothetical protein